MSRNKEAKTVPIEDMQRLRAAGLSNKDIAEALGVERHYVQDQIGSRPATERRWVTIPAEGWRTVESVAEALNLPIVPGGNAVNDLIGSIANGELVIRRRTAKA